MLKFETGKLINGLTKRRRNDRIIIIILIGLSCVVHGLSSTDTGPDDGTGNIILNWAAELASFVIYVHLHFSFNPIQLNK